MQHVSRVGMTGRFLHWHKVKLQLSCMHVGHHGLILTNDKNCILWPRRCYPAKYKLIVPLYWNVTTFYFGKTYNFNFKFVFQMAIQIKYNIAIHSEGKQNEKYLNWKLLLNLKQVTMFEYRKTQTNRRRQDRQKQ